MKIIILLIVGFIFIVSPVFRCIVFNPLKTVYYSVTDFYNWIKYKKWRIAQSGIMRIYTGLFGRGKTLSAVHYIVGIYNKYNDRLVYDSNRKKWVKQRIVICSNVDLDIPFIRLDSLHQIVSWSDGVQAYDNENDTLSFLYVLCDEMSTQLNCRNFKTNISADVLNATLTCRHARTSIIGTSQRFHHVDALYRQITQEVYECAKLWRFQRISVYDGYELENCTNPLLVQSKFKTCWFVTNKDYSAYDTLANVETLKKEAYEGNMLSDAEILTNRMPNIEADTVKHFSRIGKKRMK